MSKSCPNCAIPLLSFTYGEWGCGRCGYQEVDLSEAPRVTFRSDSPPHFAALRRRKTTGSPRRGAGMALVGGLLLMAAGLATAAYVLITDPDTAGLFAFPVADAGSDAQPDDHRPPVATDGVFHREFNWKFQGRTYTWSMNITEASYDYFSSLDRPVRRYQERSVWKVQPAYDIYVSHRDDDPFIDALAQALLQQAQKERFTDNEAASFTLAFVQSLNYTRDEVTTSYDEYPRFPVETLVDEGGDCEDTAILYASLVIAMGYGSIMVSPPQHMAVGVQADAGFRGVKYPYKGLEYAYAETTGDGYGIGDIPDEYRGTEVAVYDLAPKPLFSLQVEFGQVTRDGHQEIILKATQTGSAAAHGVQLRASVGRTASQTYDADQCDMGDVQPGQAIECRLRLDLNQVPRGTKVSIRCIVQDEDYIFDEADSTPWVPRA